MSTAAHMPQHNGAGSCPSVSKQNGKVGTNGMHCSRGCASIKKQSKKVVLARAALLCAHAAHILPTHSLAKAVHPSKGKQKKWRWCAPALPWPEKTPLLSTVANCSCKVLLLQSAVTKCSHKVQSQSAIMKCCHKVQLHSAVTKRSH
eukprot:scaffold250722_cov22-Tisochrysis_lutea.AAC.1